MGKNINNEDHSDTQAVFRMKPKPHSSECEIKHVGYLLKDQQLGDEQVDITTSSEMQEEYGKNVYHVGKFKKYDVFFSLYKTNMIGSYLANNRVLPVYNISFMYKKSIVMGYLFDIYVYFDIKPESYVKLGTLKSLVNACVDGRYLMKLEGDIELFDNKDKLYDNIDNSVLLDIANLDINNIKEEEVIEKVNKLTADKKKYYDNLLNGVDIGVFINNHKFINNVIMPLLLDKNMHDLINYAIDIREEKRRKELNAMEGEYKIPDKVIDLKKVKENPDIVKNIIS